MRYLILLILTLLTTTAAASQNKSVYTNLTEKTCRTIEADAEGAGWYRGLCAGAGGYRLELLEGDLRQSINVVAPDRKKHELELWTNVSSAFSSLGEKAEWRVRNGRPYALIVRFNASTSAENPQQIVSYLVVVKISARTVCLTDIVKPAKDQNAAARRLADESTDKPCYARAEEQ